MDDVIEAEFVVDRDCVTDKDSETLPVPVAELDLHKDAVTVLEASCVVEIEDVVDLVCVTDRDCVGLIEIE